MVSTLQRFHCTCMHTTVGRNERTLVYSMSCRVSSDSCVSPFLSDMLLTVNNPKLEEERTGKFMLVLLTFLSGCSHDLFVHLLMSLGLSS